ncbi:unnamed protein product [Durusdinium trenchii]|uniref:Autophagy protein 5 n=1 Tax=Durusdinium trenchii TaxID=1381693 RepID=A0ABP0JNX9_9DINO
MSIQRLLLLQYPIREAPFPPPLWIMFGQISLLHEFVDSFPVEVHRLGPSWMVFLSELKGIMWEMLNGFSVGRHLVHDAPPPLPDPGALLVEVTNCQREAANCQQYLVAWALNLDAMSGLQFQAALGGAVEACGSLFAALPEVELLDELAEYL